MKLRYLPDDAAVPGFPWNITALSQRDVELTIPIPFVTAPGVALSAACFASRQYDDYAAAKCISNLLALGFRRLYVDLYWDAGRHAWSLCPVQIPHSSAIDTTTRRTTAAPSTKRPPSSNTSPAPTSSTRPVRRRRDALFGSETTRLHTPSETPFSVSRATVSVVVSTSADTTIAVLPTTSPSRGVDEILYSIGPYTCSKTSGVDILNSVLFDFLDTTDTTLAAALKYIVLNLHAAASAVRPTAPAPEPDESALPARSDHLGELFKAKFDEYLFTPRILRIERHNLKDSWYETRVEYRPQPAYYSRVREQGALRTPNGWPSESVMEFQQGYHHRLVVGFGSIDPQMRGYNITRDAQLIFPPRMLDASDQGCIFNYAQPDLSSTNNSWSTSAIPDVLRSQIAQGSSKNTRLPSVANLVECGISPILNQTLSDGTAATDIKPYRQVAYSAIWSWAPGEPTVKPDSEGFRCAILDPAFHGRWRVADCSDEHRVACRVHHLPFQWAISPSSDNYKAARELCPPNSTFGVPRTSLENRYLLETYRRTHGHAGADADAAAAKLEPIWIDFNSMDAATCWVSGVNTTCPYDVRANSEAQIYVPTVAGVVILIVAALLLLLKCGANRRKSRRRRRGSGGWDYEGVPS